MEFAVAAPDAKRNRQRHQSLGLGAERAVFERFNHRVLDVYRQIRAKLTKFLRQRLALLIECDLAIGHNISSLIGLRMHESRVYNSSKL